jgi:hypothetical protein
MACEVRSEVAEQLPLLGTFSLALGLALLQSNFKLALGLVERRCLGFVCRVAQRR